MNTHILRLFGVLAIVVLARPRSADANAPAGHYVVTAGSGADNGTVYDTKSRLTWQQTAPLGWYTLADAKTYCASAAVSQSLGGTGWRLPTIKELQSIVDRSQTSGPSVDQSAFASARSSPVWSSSPVAGSPSSAWCVNFNNGITVSYGILETSRVRCVR